MITIEHVCRAAAAEFCVTVAEVRGRSRLKEFIAPRFIAMHVARRLTRRSLPSIGRYFDGRDHSSIIHGIACVEGLAGRRPGVAARIDNVAMKAIRMAEIEESLVSRTAIARAA